MTTLEQQMQDSIDYGYIYAKCVECGTELNIEVDASTGFCDECDKVVEVDNQIYNMDMI